MTGKNQNISYEDYCETLKTGYSDFRDRVCKVLGISEETFYYKNRNKSWDYAEQRIISEIIGIQHKILFPETQEKIA